MIAVSFDAVGGLRLQAESESGKCDGKGIGEVMPGVGNQRQAAGADAGNQLDDTEQKGGVERPF